MVFSIGGVQTRAQRLMSLIQTLVANVSTLNAALAQETSQRLVLESTLATERSERVAAVAAEQSARQSVEAMLSTSVVMEANWRAGNDSQLSSGLTTEQTNRVAGDAALSTAVAQEVGVRAGNVSALSAQLTVEQSVRSAAVAQLSSGLTLETSQRTGNDSQLSQQIVNEQTSRMSGDNTVTNLVTLEAAYRSGNDSAINTALALEQSARMANATALANAIAQEATFRANNDTSINAAAVAAGNLEAAYRQSNDSLLNTLIVIEAGTRLASDNSLNTTIAQNRAIHIANETLLNNLIVQESTVRAAADVSLNTTVQANSAQDKSNITNLASSVGVLQSTNTVQILSVNYRDDFIANSTPKASWAYGYNTQSLLLSGSITNNVWNPSAGAQSGSTGGYSASATAYPATGRLGYVTLTATGGHPGSDGVQSSSGYDTYAIAQWTVTLPGYYFVNGWAIHTSGSTCTTDGTLLVVLRNSTVVVSQFMPTNKVTRVRFAATLGNMNMGEFIRVGMGPKGVDSCDSFQWDFYITATSTVVGITPPVNSTLIE